MRRDKFSVFNFLNNPTASERERQQQENTPSEPPPEAPRAIEAPPPESSGTTIAYNRASQGTSKIIK